MDAYGFEAEDKCPSCGSDKGRDPNLKLFFANCCDARMCENCIVQKFSQKRKIECVGCGEPLERSRYKKNSLVIEKFRKETEIRKRINGTFNRFEDEFETKKEWNDYLELVEDLVYNGVYGDLSERREVERRLAQEKKLNRSRIEKNNVRRIHQEQERAGDGTNLESEQVVKEIIPMELVAPPNLIQTMTNDFEKMLYEAMQKRKPEEEKVVRKKLKCQQKAGGFMESISHFKNKIEAKNALFYFPY